MNGWNPKNKILPSALSEIAGVVTNQVISDKVTITAKGALNGRADFYVSAVTVVGSVTVKLQDSSDGGTNWNDVKSLAITSTGVKPITWLEGVGADQAFLPLRRLLRAVVTTTNAGDKITLTSIQFLVED